MSVFEGALKCSEVCKTCKKMIEMFSIKDPVELVSALMLQGTLKYVPFRSINDSVSPQASRHFGVTNHDTFPTKNIFRVIQIYVFEFLKTKRL